MADEILEMSPSDIEDAITSGLEATPPDASSLLPLIKALYDARKVAHANKFSSQLEERLVTAGAFDDLIKLFEIVEPFAENRRSFSISAGVALKGSAKTRLLAAEVDSVGFGAVPFAESIRRLALLRALKDGVSCLDKTWGFGIVRRVDDFYKRITIDFDSAPRHQMAMTVAAEGLQLVADDHFLAQLHSNAAQMKTWAEKEPGRIVKMVLQSFGPSSVMRLEELLVERYKFIAAKDWKRFWENARKALREDPLVEIPVKRADSITLRQKALEYDADWFAALAKLNDIDELLRRTLAYETALGHDGAPALDDETRAILTNRMEFALKGAHGSDPARYARIMQQVLRLKLESPAAADMCAHLIENKRFIKAGFLLSARDCESMVASLIANDAEAAGKELLATLPEMGFTLLNETMLLLRKCEVLLPQVKERCGELMAQSDAPTTLLAWVMKHVDALKEWPLPSQYQLLLNALAAVEKPCRAGEELRVQHVLREIISNHAWFETRFKAFTDLQREAVYERISGSNSVTETAAAKHRLLQLMAKIEPSLTEQRKNAADSQKSEPANIHITSWRSLREHQEALRKLTEEEMPKNREEIAVARSYGDLSENFEYQSAKDHERILINQQAKWDAEIKAMRGTDFAGVGNEIVAAGTMVTIAKADGTNKTFTILGEWDSDASLNIIPNRSKLAEALIGKRVGETAMIPSELGTESVSIAEIARLSDEIKAWIA